MRRLFTKREALAALRISPATLDRMISRGLLPVVRISTRAIRISETDLLALVEQSTERRTAGPHVLVSPGNGLAVGAR